MNGPDHYCDDLDCDCIDDPEPEYPPIADLFIAPDWVYLTHTGDGTTLLTDRFVMYDVAQAPIVEAPDAEGIHDLVAGNQLRPEVESEPIIDAWRTLSRHRDRAIVPIAWSAWSHTREKVQALNPVRVRHHVTGRIGRTATDELVAIDHDWLTRTREVFTLYAAGDAPALGIVTRPSVPGPIRLCGWIAPMNIEAGPIHQAIAATLTDLPEVTP